LAVPVAGPHVGAPYTRPPGRHLRPGAGRAAHRGSPPPLRPPSRAVRRLRLWHALSASAAVHLALLAGLLALAHPAASIVPRLRVSLLGAPRQAGGEGVAARPEPGGREGRAERPSAASAANPRHLDRPGRDEERATHPPPSAPGPARHAPAPPELATLAPAAQRREVARGAEPGSDEGAGASQVAAL